MIFSNSFRTLVTDHLFVNLTLLFALLDTNISISIKINNIYRVRYIYLIIQYFYNLLIHKHFECAGKS